MLKSLRIQNYALIDHLEINFSHGLNTITGETGAGKSILLGALTLLLGQRADSSYLKDPSKNCVVEAEFSIADYNLEEFFEQNNIDFDPEICIRRIINENGKSRAYINETPVNLGILKQLGDSLLDIHSQHQNLLLGSTQFQMKVLDTFAGVNDELVPYKADFKEFKQITAELQTLVTQAQDAEAEHDYLKHQFQELENAHIKPGELAELEELQKQLAHANEIKTALQQCAQTVNNEPDAILTSIKTMQTALKHIVSHYSPAQKLDERLETCRIELKDIAAEAEAQFAHIDVNENELSQTSERIDLLYSLLQKHRAATPDELLALQHQFGQQIAHLESLDFDIEQTRKRLNDIKLKLGKQAAKISQKRKAAVPTLEANITQLLEQLGIKYATFKVEIENLPEFQGQGTDRITFYFSANKQIAPSELSRVASGGELSRLMLSLKSLLAESSGLATIIFDEIDTGVSGEIADRMGSIIAEMSERMQVINITHLPQIAAKGLTHFQVYKDHSAAQTQTRISLLSPEQRLITIAQMLSGEKVTEAAISNARELLKK